MCKKGYCIICREDNKELSDEHVIPESIGGYYHIYNVCKTCNSKLGDHVDKHLLDHWFIKASRYEKKLKGYTGKIPNPIIGKGELSTGEKVSVEQDDNGIISVKFIPKPPEASDDGKSYKIQVDIEDKNKIPGIVTKILKRRKIDESKVQIVSNTEIVKIDQPEIKMQFLIDTKSYKIGLLKIAYEFAVDNLKEYIEDPISKLYANILHEGNTARIDEAFFEGDAISNANLKILDSFVDSSNTNRHILLLLNVNKKLYCVVKLFDKFCQMIKMSDNFYEIEGSGILAINDFEKKRCDIYKLTELIELTNLTEYTTFKLKDEDQKYLDSQMDKDGIGFACDQNHDNILFDCHCIPLCTENNLLLTLEKLDLTKNVNVTDTSISVTYTIPFGYHYLCMPEEKLLMVKEITKVNEFKKI